MPKPIAGPNHTQVPNIILDGMSDMIDSELRVVLAVCRKTFGWQKRQDRLSISQLMTLTGLSRQGILDGLRRAMDNEIIFRTPSGQSYEYGLIVHDEEEPVKPVDRLAGTGQASRPELVKPVDTQKKGNKNTDTTTTGVLAEAIALFENNICAITPLLKENIVSALEDYPPTWFGEAVAVAVAANVRRWSYIEAVLRRWQTEGFKSERQKPAHAAAGGNGGQARGKGAEPKGFAAIRAIAQREGIDLEDNRNE